MINEALSLSDIESIGFNSFLILRIKRSALLTEQPGNNVSINCLNILFTWQAFELPLLSANSNSSIKIPYDGASGSLASAGIMQGTVVSFGWHKSDSKLLVATPNATRELIMIC